MVSDERVPTGIEVERPSSARIYDYYLGGAHNFAVDRQVAEQMLTLFPQTAQVAQANRAFLRRAVEYLIDAGVRQFLDIGSGIPTVGHVHEIAQRAAPEARVVFVDIDPVAVEHSRQILAGNDLTGVVKEDIRRPEQILAAPETTRLLDITEPVGVLAVSLFPFIPDADDPAGLIARLTGSLAPGSYLAISHATADRQEAPDEAMEVYRRAGIELTLRSREQVEALFGGFELVEPGVVWVPLWHPESSIDVFSDQPASSGFYAGVGRKP